MDLASLYRPHLGAWLQELALRQPERPAISDASGVLDWAGYAKRLRQVGNVLLGLGLAHGDRVALLLPDTRIYLESDHGVMSAGFVRVPLNPGLAHSELVALLKSSGARALITEVKTAAHLDLTGVPELHFILTTGGSEKGTLDFDALLAAASDEPLPLHDAQDLATLSYSGGTTGEPKGIALRHDNLSTVLRHTIEAFEIPAHSVFLNVRPLWPIAQLVAFAHLAAGGTILLGGKFEPSSFADLVESSGATHTSLVPTLLFRLLPFLQPADDRLKRLAAIYLGGSRLQPEVFEQAVKQIGPRLGVLYGMTEAPISCYLSPAMTLQDADARMSVGKPVAGCTVRVATPEGSTDMPGIVGEVLLRGRHVMQGYWKNQTATAAALQDGWLHTGDVGCFDEAGRLHITGRIKEVIRTGATSVMPIEVEDVLMTHEAVMEVAVVGLPDSEWGERVAAFVVLHPGAVADEATLKTHCKLVLTGHKCPRSIYFVDRLPRSHYGKVLRAELIQGVTE